ncbi:MAG: FAD-dependent oxidoreductase [Pseudolysinimonas sp.]
MATPDRAVVVGGGLAGLIVARRLALEGSEVVVLEASDRLGGQLARHTVAGIPLDAGAEAFATRSGTVARLARALGLGDDIVDPAPAPAWLHRADGTAVALPATSVLGIPGVPLATDVIRAIGWRAAWRAQLDTLMLGQFGSRSRTLGELVRRRMGAGVLDGLVAPVVRGVHSAHPDELDLDAASPGLRRAFLREGNLASAVRSLRGPSAAGSQVAGIRGGVFRLVDALTDELQRFGVELRTGERVVSADHVGVELESGERVTGSVVVAAPGVTGEPDAGRVVSLVTLVVAAPELDAAPRGTGVLVAAGADVQARALTHVTAKWPWVAELAGGRHVLRLSYDGVAPGDAVARAGRDAATLLGVGIPAPDDAAVVTWERAAPRTHAVDGMHYVGESVSGTGIAAVVAQADQLPAGLHPPVEGGSDTEPQG